MKEREDRSFIFHETYISRLPEEYKAKFMGYVFNYGIYGTVPEVEGLELTIWEGIQERIDTEKAIYNEKKEKRSAAGKVGGKNHKGNQYTRKNNEESSKGYCEEINEESSSCTSINDDTSEEEDYARKNDSAENDSEMESNENLNSEINDNGNIGSLSVSDSLSEYVNESDNEFECESESVSVSVPKTHQKHPASTRFVKPNYDEVREYCAQNGYTINPERFVDYYESKGWKIGSSPMKNWRAAVRTWEAKQKDFDSGQSAKTSADKWPEDRLEL